LLPTQERREIIGFWLAKAATRCPGIQLFAIMQMSDHLHLVLRDSASQLSEFMQYFLSHCAKSLNRLDQVRGPVFERRFAAIAVLDATACIDRIAYAICNPAKASLVRSHREWAGLWMWHGSDQASLGTFSYFHEARYEKARRSRGGRDTPVDREDFVEEARLEVVPFDEVELESISDAITRREREIQREKQSVLGMKRVLRGSPFDRARRSKRSRMPLCLTTCREARSSFVNGWLRFLKSYREASKEFRQGLLDYLFPLFCFRPRPPLLT
jgi:hypothetical protein